MKVADPPGKDKALLVLLSVLQLGACALHPPQKNLSLLNQRLVDLALGEWHYFGRQTVRLTGEREIIDPVGHWEDEAIRANRVNQYWRAVGRPELTGQDCTEPWSAAFISWLMQTAGVPPDQFRRADAHWVYLNEMMRKDARGQGGFVPHRLNHYRPTRGDLICAYREPLQRIRWLETMNELPPATRLHCDVVVYRARTYLEVIGGNVRNSVSKTIVPLDLQGDLRPTPQRHWFLAVEMKSLPE